MDIDHVTSSWLDTMKRFSYSSNLFRFQYLQWDFVESHEYENDKELDFMLCQTFVFYW